MEEIKVSGKHIRLKAILFLLAFVVGVTAFATAAYSMTNRKTGYYEITATRDETAPIYSNGYAFYCYIDGGSNEIKSNLSKIGSLYSESLGRIFRLLDPKETYEGYVNLATLNRHPGEDIALPAELYEILVDAIQRSEDAGFTLYDGALKSLWAEILYLEEPESFDPHNDAFQWERMKAARDAIQSRKEVNLTIVNAETYTVRLEVSDAYRAAMNRYEIEAPLLDLGILREAYSLQYVCHKLIENGFSKGYLTTESGMHLSLPQTEYGKLPLYGYVDGQAETAAAIFTGKGAACCALRSFSIGEKGYYAVEEILRHPYLGPEGEPNRQILTAWAVSKQGDIVEAAEKVLSLYTVSLEEAEERLAVLGTKQIAMGLIACHAPKTILSDPLHEKMIQPISESRYTVSAP